jgi:SAM-dependent methyltransferase
VTARFLRDAGYRQRVQGILRGVLEGHVPVRRALDFGAGDGWFARRMQADGIADEIVAVDVMARRDAAFDVRLYDGARLPFPDRSFDLAYAVDVLHHCDDPRERLLDLLRCADRYLLLKDHTHSGAAGRLTLALLDELGNRRFGVRSVYRYQRRWEWLPAIEAAGFQLDALVHPAPCQGSALGWLTNRLQFVGLWRRVR